jgi:hypothetical protein
MSNSSQPPRPETTPVSQDADATVEQLHERAHADYANGSDDRNAFDSHVRRYGSYDTSI